MKIIHLSDLHIGHYCYGNKKRRDLLHQNFTADKENGLRNTIQKRSPDVVIISGDLFDNPTPTYEEQNVLRQFIHFLKKDCGLEVYGITGNHEKQYNSSVQAAQYFGIGLPEEPISIKGGIKIAGIDHIHKTFLPETIQKIKKTDILVMHQSAAGFLAAIMRPELDDEMLHQLSTKCKYLALGDLHIHKKMTIGECTIAYPGSVDFLRVGEPMQFGFWEIDTEKEFESKTVEYETIQRTTKVLVNSTETMQTVIKEAQKASGDFLVLGIDQSCLSETEIESFEQEIEKIESENPNFVVRFVYVNKKEQQEKTSLKEETSEFIDMIYEDNSISEEAKDLASSLWKANSNKDIEKILFEDLSKTK